MCNSCEKGYMSKSILQAHMKGYYKGEKLINSETKACPQCGKDCKGVDALIFHIKKVHDTDIRIASNYPEQLKQALEEFGCKACEAISFANSNLFRHQIKVH